MADLSEAKQKEYAEALDIIKSGETIRVWRRDLPINQWLSEQGAVYRVVQVEEQSSYIEWSWPSE